MIVAVDPGISGAIAVLTSSGSLVSLHDMPMGADDLVDIGVFAAIVGRPDVGIVEHAQAMPMDGRASLFKYAAAYGAAACHLRSVSKQFRLVRPAQWKRDLSISTKADSLKRARDMWGHNFFPLQRDHNRAEAALLGHWWASQ